MSSLPTAPAASPLRVLWIQSGSPNSESGLTWLRQRMQDFQFAQRQVAVLDHAWPSGSDQPSSCHYQRLTERIDCGVERIVVACVNRLDYPVELIDFLQRTCPEVPLAVASDSWWDGRRRTGLATPGHLSLAWYRWWDGWVDWLQGRSPALFEVAPAPWPILSSQPPANTATTARGLIVGNCRQTTDAWSRAANAAGHAAGCISWLQFQQQFPAQWSQPLPTWVLWDDTCLDTSNAAVAQVGGVNRCHKFSDGAEQGPVQGAVQGAAQGAVQGACAESDEAAMRIFFERLSRADEQRRRAVDLSAARHGWPNTEDILGIVAVCMPRAVWVTRLCSAPGSELLVKPAGGQGLMRLLGQAAAASRSDLS